MNSIIIAAVKVCFLVGTVHGGTITYPTGYEDCPALIAEEDREAAAVHAASKAAEQAEIRRAYERGAEELEK
jgi:hypothetical protein